MKPAQDRARAVAQEQVVATGAKGDDVGHRRRASEVAEHALGCVPRRA